VVDYILSSSVSEKLESYHKFFNSIANSHTPYDGHTPYDHYTVQYITSQIQSTNNYMMEFIKIHNLEPTNSVKIYNQCLQSIKKVSYISPIENFKCLHPTFFMDEDTFLFPQKIQSLIENAEYINTIEVDFDKIHNVEYILTNKGPYKLLDKSIEYYVLNFKCLLDTDILSTKIHIANVKTLLEMSRDVYSYNRTQLESLPKSEFIDHMLKIYNTIIL
jgi:hypothetical protein